MEQQAVGGCWHPYAMIVAPGMMMRISLVGVRGHFVAVTGPMAGMRRLDCGDWSEGFQCMRRRLSARRNGKQETKEKREQPMHGSGLPHPGWIVVPYGSQSFLTGEARSMPSG
jgi:hypothetical protein